MWKRPKYAAQAYRYAKALTSKVTTTNYKATKEANKEAAKVVVEAKKATKASEHIKTTYNRRRDYQILDMVNKLFKQSN